MAATVRTVNGLDTRGHPWEVVIVTDRDLTQMRAEVENIVGRRRRVSLAFRRGPKMPEVGEHWVIDRALGDWTFAALYSDDPSLVFGGGGGGGGTSNVEALRDLTDVSDALDPHAHYVLTFNPTTGMWDAEPISVPTHVHPAPSISLAQLADVSDDLTPLGGYVLTYNPLSLQWEAKPPTASGAGVTKFTRTNIVLATGLAASTSYAWTTIPSVAMRGLIWRFRIAATASTNWSFQVASGPGGSGELMFEATNITISDYYCSWPWMFENQETPQADTFYVGVKNTAPTPSNFTLLDLRGDRYL